MTLALEKNEGAKVNSLTVWIEHFLERYKPMFVGHYAAGLALKKLDKKAPLGALFVAAQFLDILFFPFVLLGIERMNIVENFTPSTHFELEYIPYSHSLLAAMLWTGVAYVLFRWIFIKKHSMALIVAVAVFSHWIFDFLVHTQDLPVWNDASPKLGLGIWNNAIATYVVEAGLLLIGLWLYLGSTKALTVAGKYGMATLVGFLLLINVPTVFGEPMVDTVFGFSIFAMTSYAVFAALAFWLDRQRA